MTKSNSRLQIEGKKLLLGKIGYSTDVSNEDLDSALDVVLSNPTLTQREIQILRERYLGDNLCGTYSEAASRLGCTACNVRTLEENALRKIKHPESIPPRYVTLLRLTKLIPTLEYDVLYDPSSIEKKLGTTRQHLTHGINQLTKEFDLAQVQAIHPAGKRYIMRIGEQSEDLPIPLEPSDHPSIPEDLHFLSQEEYATEYMQFWKRIVSRIKSSGYTSSKFDLGSYRPEIRKKVFRDFIRDSMLPVAVYQDYRMGYRDPSIVYHPKILRDVRKK